MEIKKIKVILNRLLIVLFVGLVIIQVFHPAKNNDPATTTDDITKMYPISDSVATILHTACYDCHSNNTVYPWYNNIQPVAWWLDDHIKEGKHHVNFSEFGKYPLAKQAKKLRKCAREINEGEMPINFYLWIHTNARLSPREKDLLVNWLSDLSKQLYDKSGTKPS